MQPERICVRVYDLNDVRLILQNYYHDYRLIIPPQRRWVFGLSPHGFLLNNVFKEAKQSWGYYKLTINEPMNININIAPFPEKHMHSGPSIFVRTFIDVMYYLAPNPNQYS